MSFRRNAALFAPVILVLVLALPASAQWTASSTGLSQTLGFYHGQNLIIKGGNNLYVAENNNIHRSTDNAASWTSILAGLPTGARISWMAATATRLYVAYYTGSPTTGGFHYSSDGGTTWTNTGITIGANYISGLAASGDTVVAYDGRPRLHVSTNGGATWTESATTPPTQSGNVALLNGVLYLSGDNGLHRSTNLGASWTQATAEDGYTLAASGATLYYGTRPGLYRSTDNGVTWASRGTGFPAGVDVWTLVAKDSVLAAPVYRSSFGAGVYVSTDGGANWRAFNEGLAANAKISSIVEKDGVLYGTAAGVFKRALSQATTSLSSRDKRTVALTIGYAAPRHLFIAVPVRSGALSVRLVSTRGATVVEGVLTMDAHGATLDVTTVPAGVYTVSVTGAGLRETRTIALR